MKALKPYLLIAALAATIISLIVVVVEFFVRQTVVGYFAVWVFGISLSLFIGIGIPGDDD